MRLLKKYGLKEFRDATSPTDMGSAVYTEIINAELCPEYSERAR